MDKIKLHARIAEAISAFWNTKQKQLSSSGDSSNRGAVTAGKQLDGFIALLKDIAIQQGVPEECIYVSKAYLPGYFRSSKDWDFLIVTPARNLFSKDIIQPQLLSAQRDPGIMKKCPTTPP